MRVPADDVAAMTKPPTARPDMTPPPTEPDQIAMMKIATWSAELATQEPNFWERTVHAWTAKCKTWNPQH